MTQFVLEPPPGVHDATAVGPVVATRHATKVGPVVFRVQVDTGSSVLTTGVQVVVFTPEVPGVQELTALAALTVTF